MKSSKKHASSRASTWFDSLGIVLEELRLNLVLSIWQKDMEINTISGSARMLAQGHFILLRAIGFIHSWPKTTIWQIDSCYTVILFLGLELGLNMLEMHTWSKRDIFMRRIKIICLSIQKHGCVVQFVIGPVIRWPFWPPLVRTGVVCLKTIIWENTCTTSTWSKTIIENISKTTNEFLPETGSENAQLSNQHAQIE